MMLFLNRTLFILFLSCSLVKTSIRTESHFPEDNPVRAALALDVFERMNQSGKWRYPEQFADGTLEPFSTRSFYWDMKKVSIGPRQVMAALFKRPWFAPLVLGEPTLEHALEDLLASEGVFDCRITYYIAAALCALPISEQATKSIERLGRRAIIALSAPMEDSALQNSKLECHILKGAYTLDEGGTAVPLGTFYGIANVPLYEQIHPRGFAASWNVVCVDRNADGEELFMGFDPKAVLFSEPRTRQGILEYFYLELLKPIDERLIRADQLEVFQEMQEAYRGDKESFLSDCAKRQRNVYAMFLK